MSMFTLRCFNTSAMSTCFRHAITTFILIASVNISIANAQLTLTPATAAAGWKLTTFVTGWTPDSNGVGPTGIGFTDSGGVLVSGPVSGGRLFPTDADGQDVKNAASIRNFGSDVTRVGNSFYTTNWGNGTGGRVDEINPDGTFKQTIVSGFYEPLGIVPNPANGHLFEAAGGGHIGDIDPIAKTVTVFATLPAAADGLSTDGTTLYVACNGHILGYRISDKQQVFDSGYIIGADGCAVGFGSVFVNTNYGQVFQIDLATRVITLICTNGSRGDFIKVDPNGSLLITTSYGIWRLTPPPGQSFVTASVAVQPSIVAGGANAIGTVTLSLPAPKNLDVILSSSSASIQVPAKVTVLAGSNTATFSINTTAVSTVTTGQVTATLNNINSSAPLTVRPLGVKSISFDQNSIQGGKTVKCTVTLEGKAGPGNITVTFASSNIAAVGKPAPITIAAGQTSATFTLKTKVVATEATVTISATANQIGGTANLTVTP